MRPALLAASTALLAALAVFACSSSDNTTVVPAADGGGSTSSSSGSDDESGGSSGGSSGSTTSSGGTTTSSGGTTTSSGGTTTSSGGTTTSSSGGVDSGAPVDGGTAGTLCFAQSEKESEPNNEVGAADPVMNRSGTYCGRLEAAGDVDHMTFILPSNATGLSMSQSTTDGSIKVEVTADGEAFPFTANGPDFKFKPGKSYVLKISTSGATLDYRITVNITCGGDGGACM